MTMIAGTSGGTWLSVSAGQFSMGAIGGAVSTDLNVWGRNDFGQLGQNDKVDRSSPIQIAGTWKKLAVGDGMMLAIADNDTLWSWGKNTNGQLGLGDKDDRSSPVQISSGSWIYVSASGKNAAAIDSSNNLWVWGDNYYGQLGQNDLIPRSSPVQVPGSNYVMVSVGVDYMGAIQNSSPLDDPPTVASLWMWGRNSAGQQGQADFIDRSSPTQVGTELTWQFISCGFTTTLAIKNDSGYLSAFPYCGRLICLRKQHIWYFR